MEQIPIRRYRSVSAQALADGTVASSMTDGPLVVDLAAVPAGGLAIAVREHVARWMGAAASGTEPVWVRVHGGDDGLDDIALVAPEAGDALAGVLVPDVFDGRELDAVRRELELAEAVLDREDRPFPVGLVIGSASAVLDSRDLAETERVSVLVLDEIALREELGIAEGGVPSVALAMARGQVVLASAAAGRWRPISWGPTDPPEALAANGFSAVVIDASC